MQCAEASTSSQKMKVANNDKCSSNSLKFVHGNSEPEPSFVTSTQTNSFETISKDNDCSLSSEYLVSGTSDRCILKENSDLKKNLE